MVEYIDRQAAIEALRRAEALTRAFGYHNVIETIREVPSADVEPVRHGRWMEIVEANEQGEPYQAGVLCSECREAFVFEPNYCPNCGASMDGEANAE